MIRKILKSDKNTLTLNLPDDLVGRVIGVIAFPVEGDAGFSETKTIQHRQKIFQG